MNFPLLILILSCPLCVLDLTLRGLQIAPPMWVSDSMAAALILLGFGLLWKTLKRNKETNGAAPVPSRLESQSPAIPGNHDWKQSLPCLFHEIQNYSSTLRGNTQLLRLQLPSAGMLEPLGRLERTTAKIECLAREIIETASITGVTRTTSIDAVNLIKGCILDHFSEMREAFHIETDPEIDAIDGDFLKLERVFLNLFRNAMQAGARNIHVRLSEEKTRLRILVEDDGQGCSSEQIARMFRHLYTTRKETGGTGLGLYMVKAIMESHGGAIHAVSKNAWGGNKTGMIFSLELPKPSRSISTVPGGEPRLIWHTEKVM